MFGNTVTLNGPGGSNNASLTGGEDSSYDGVVYVVHVDNVGNITVSDPVGYDLNTVGTDDVLVLNTPTGQLDFTLDMDDLPIGTAVNDIDLWGQIDQINIGGVGTQEDNTLILSAQDVLDLVDLDKALWISGEAGDAVVLTDAAGWDKGSTSVAPPPGGVGLYTEYTLISDPTVKLYVDNELTQPTGTQP